MSEKRAETSAKKQAIGVGQKLLASMFYGSMGMWSVLMAGRFSLFNQGYLRAGIMLAVLIVIGVAGKQFRKIERRDWKWFGLTMLGGLNAIPYYYGFVGLGSSIGTLVFCVAMVVSGYFVARVFFKEKITAVKIVSLLVATAGLLVIYRFGISAEQIVSALVMVLAGALASVSTILPKKLSGDYSQVQIMTMTFAAVFVVCLPLSLIFGEVFPAFALDMAWVALGIYAVVHMLAMYFNVTSFKVLDASVGILLDFSEIIFGVLFGIIFLGEEFLAAKVVGFVLIVVGISLEYVVEFYRRRRATAGRT